MSINLAKYREWGGHSIFTHLGKAVEAVGADHAVNLRVTSQRNTEQQKKNRRGIQIDPNYVVVHL